MQITHYVTLEKGKDGIKLWKTISLANCDMLKDGIYSKTTYCLLFLVSTVLHNLNAN